ncbi:flavin-binding monooxygenase [Aspergillus crustosus]
MSDEYPPLAALPQLTLHPSINTTQLDAAKIANDWLSSLTESLSTGHKDAISALFLQKESWWRDFVSLSWDIASPNGAEAISDYLARSGAWFREPKSDQPGVLQPHLAEMGPFRFIQTGFSFRTDSGAGRGVLRLANVGPEEWKAWTVFTVLEGLKEQEGQKVRKAEDTETDDDPQVLVVGAGQSGLALAAHLQSLGLKYLVVDKSAGSGAAWRARYKSVTSHTPSYTDYTPFLKYPTNWPRYLGREHIITWLEHYGDIMRLNIQHDTLASGFQYNDSTKKWSVELQSRESTKTITPKHVVLATGLLSNIPIQPSFPGQESFKGQVYHTLAHISAALVPDIQSKNVTVIGSGTSAHDVAQDFVEHGAKSVTMVQRQPIFVTSRNSLETFQLKTWDTPGLSTEDADLLGNSLPTAVVRTLSIGASQMMAANDKVLLDGLERAGLAVKRGEGGDSLVDHQLIKAGRFYIEQGASQMIIDGQIQVRRCEGGVQEYDQDGIILADGTKIPSDIVILATGFERVDKVVGRLMGKDVMGKVGDICRLDDSQERIGVWRPTGMPGFWYMTGSFIWARQFAPLLALQIAAVERDLNSKYYNKSE